MGRHRITTCVCGCGATEGLVNGMCRARLKAYNHERYLKRKAKMYASGERKPYVKKWLPAPGQRFTARLNNGTEHRRAPFVCASVDAHAVHCASVDGTEWVLARCVWTFEPVESLG